MRGQPRSIRTFTNEHHAKILEKGYLFRVDRFSKRDRNSQEGITTSSGNKIAGINRGSGIHPGFSKSRRNPQQRN